MLPGILNQLGAESLTHLKRLASNVGAGGMGGAVEAAGTMDEEDDDEVPDLVENFDEVSKNETATATEEAKISEVEEVTGEKSAISEAYVAVNLSFGFFVAQTCPESYANNMLIDFTPLPNLNWIYFAYNVPSTLKLCVDQGLSDDKDSSTQL